jgi:hypothetical protein
MKWSENRDRNSIDIWNNMQNNKIMKTVNEYKTSTKEKVSNGYGAINCR